MSDPASQPPPLPKPRVSSRRRWFANILALVVVAVLAATSWRAWEDYKASRQPPRQRWVSDGWPRQTQRGFGRGRVDVAEGDEELWELHDRVRTALDVDGREWAELEPKVGAVTRLQRDLRLLPRDAPGERGAVLRVQLKTAQIDLRKSVTRTQEASLVLMGILD